MALQPYKGLLSHTEKAPRAGEDSGAKSGAFLTILASVCILNYSLPPTLVDEYNHKDIPTITQCPCNDVYN